MAKQGISTGSSPNDGTGDTLLAGAEKVNENFNEIYTLAGDGTNLAPGIVTAIAAGNNISRKKCWYRNNHSYIWINSSWWRKN